MRGCMCGFVVGGVDLELVVVPSQPGEYPVQSPQPVSICALRSVRSYDYGHRRGNRGLGKNRPSGFLIRLRSRLTAVTSGVSRRLRRAQPNHRVAGMYSSRRIPAGPCIIRTPVGSIVPA